MKTRYVISLFEGIRLTASRSEEIISMSTAYCINLNPFTG